MTLTRKTVVISLSIFLALSLITVLPSFIVAEENSMLEETKVIHAKGIAFTEIDNETIEIPVNLTLYCEATERYRRLTFFKVVDGTVELESETFTIYDGTGLVIHNRHITLLNATGTDPQGQHVTLKLAFRYFWMWGRLYIARSRGVLKVNDTKYLLILRAATKVP